jgi:hypothetical protein
MKRRHPVLVRRRRKDHMNASACETDEGWPGSSQSWKGWSETTWREMKGRNKAF